MALLNHIAVGSQYSKTVFCLDGSRAPVQSASRSSVVNVIAIDVHRRMVACAKAEASVETRKF
jgi:hypothetical protein